MIRSALLLQRNFAICECVILLLLLVPYSMKSVSDHVCCKSKIAVSGIHLVFVFVLTPYCVRPSIDRVQPACFPFFLDFFTNLIVLLGELVAAICLSSNYTTEVLYFSARITDFIIILLFWPPIRLFFFSVRRLLFSMSSFYEKP